MRTLARVGVELEFAVRWGYKNKIMQRLRHHGFDIGLSHKKYSRWQCKTDPSVFSDNWEVYSPVELISPVMSFSTAKRDVYRMLRLLHQFPDVAETNRSTGLHINVSLQGGNDVTCIDPLELILACNELSTLKKWDRENNEYCEDYHYNIQEQLLNFVNYPPGQGMWQYVSERLDFDKYRSISFEHVTDNKGWIEFRMVGGDYLNKIPEVIEEIDRLCKLTVQCSEHQHKNSAYYKLRKMKSQCETFTSVLRTDLAA